MISPMSVEQGKDMQVYWPDECRPVPSKPHDGETNGGSNAGSMRTSSTLVDAIE